MKARKYTSKPMTPSMEPGPEPMVPPTSPKLLLGKYQLGRLLGRGTFAKVYSARSITDSAGVAIKVIDKSKIADAATMEPCIIREVTVMRRLRHPNVIKLHEVMATKSKIYLVMEHARGGELFSRISSSGPLKEHIARHYLQQLVSALRYCHSNGVAHRDVKLQNLLLDHDGNLKVSDFGLSALPDQLKDGLLHTACGTPAYTAPEVFRRKGYDGAKADAWSCGIILFVLLAGSLPFDDANLTSMYLKMNRREFEFPTWFSRPVRQLITRLLDPNPETRMTMDGLMEVGWFKKSFKLKGRGICDSPDQNNQTGECTHLKDSQFSLDGSTALIMNAFDIISLSSGLDLSGLFEVGRRERRFTMTASTEKILERVEEIGGKLGYKVEWRKVGTLSLIKGQISLLVEISAMAPAILLVELKATASGGVEFDELFWGDLKAGLEDVVFAWHGNGIQAGLKAGLEA